MSGALSASCRKRAAVSRTWASAERLSSRSCFARSEPRDCGPELRQPVFGQAVSSTPLHALYRNFGLRAAGERVALRAGRIEGASGEALLPAGTLLTFRERLSPNPKPPTAGRWNDSPDPPAAALPKEIFHLPRV